MTDEIINVNIPFDPNTAQRHLFEHMKRFNIFECHRGAGKTYAAIMLLIASCLGTTYKDANFAMLSPEAKQGERNIEGMFLEICKPLGDIVQYKRSEALFVFANGSKVYMLGVKNAKALRGKRWDGIILDEFATMEQASEVWHDILIPSLERWDIPNRKGWVLITTTPPQKEHFYRDLFSMASKNSTEWYLEQFPVTRTKLYSEPEILAIKSRMTPTSFAIEYMCSHNIPAEGAYYGECLVMAEEQNRITKVPHNLGLGVYASFDVGKDGTAIWFAQMIEGKFHIIDYWEEQKQIRSLSYYANVLKSKPYRYNRIWLPHDTAKNHQGAGASFFNRFKELYGNNTVKMVARENIDTGIFRGLEQFYKCHFDKLNCRLGLQALREYTPKIDKNGVVQDTPDHNWASHGADSFRYLINGLTNYTKNTEDEDVYFGFNRGSPTTRSIMDFKPF